MSKAQERIDNNKVGIGSYIALALIVLFFSGFMQSFQDGPLAWLSFFDYTTITGAFGTIGDTGANFTGSGGDGARQGFMFAFSLIPGVMVAMGAVAVAEAFGALKACQQLLTPLLKPVLGLPGKVGLTMITGLQSTDASAVMAKVLKDDGSLTEEQTTVLCAWLFSSDATITNFLSTGAALWGLTNADGSPAIKISIMIPLVLQLILKFFGANIARFYLKFKNKSDETVKKEKTVEKATTEVAEETKVEEEKKEKINPTTVFVQGATTGLNIGLKSIIPNVLMAYSIIKILNVTGLMDVIRKVLAPVMGIFGLPGQAATVLLASFLSMGGGVGAAAGLFEEGLLTGTHLAILSPAMFLAGSLLQYAGRLLAVVEVKNKGLLFGICFINAIVAMLIMNILV